MLKSFIHKIERERAKQDTNKVARPFEWGAEFLNGIKQGTPQFPSGPHAASHEDLVSAFTRYNDDALSQSDLFFGTPGPVDYHFSNDWLSFDSPIASPYDENNTAYARFFPVSDSQRRVPYNTPSLRRAVLV